MDSSSDVWRALAEPVRRDILELLRAGPLTTGAICRSIPGLSRFAVMNHLAVLKQGGLVAVEQQGRERLNRLEPAPLGEIVDVWIEAYRTNATGGVPRQRHGSGSEEKLIEAMIERNIELNAPPAAVFRALTLDIGEWWGQPYLQDDARDIVLDPAPGGLLRQLTRDGGGTVMCSVQEIRRDRLLVLSGTMRMPGAIWGTIHFELTPTKTGGTRLAFRHSARGEMSRETTGRFEKGWTELLGRRLKTFVERGRSTGVRAA